MAEPQHKAETLAPVDPSHGHLRHVLAPADNGSCVLMYEDDQRRMTLTKDGKVLHKGEHEIDVPSFALSLDGKTLALAPRRGRGDRVMLNGRDAYDVPDGFEVYRLEWLDDGVLAWNGWNRGDDGRIDDAGIRTFVNGVERTGELDFEPMIGERGTGLVVVRENGMRHVLYDDGRRTEPEPAPEDRFHHPSSYERPEMPEERWDERRTRVHVAYRGKEGPAFDGIETHGGMRSYAFNADRSRVAYVGIRYSALSRWTGRGVGAVIERVEDKRGILQTIIGWPVALLFNPYFGPGHALIEGSKRFVPVDDGRPWRRAYRYAHDHFYTPGDRLVVTANELGGGRVVIDEQEGPLFRGIENVRWLPDERAVCYLGITTTEVRRVVAPIGE